jgi:hypothetical protein
MSNPSTSGVEKIKRCRLTQWEICNKNPSTGRNFEILLKRSLETSLTSQGLTGTCRMNDEKEKRVKPDIYLDTCGRYLSFDCRHWTATEARAGRIYQSREFYQSARGEPSLAVYLRDTRRTLFVAFELKIVDSQGNRERRLFLPPGQWLQDRFDRDTGIKIDEITESWPSYGKGPDLLYDIDVCGLIDIADSFGGGRRS